MLTHAAQNALNENACPNFGLYFILVLVNLSMLCASYSWQLLISPAAELKRLHVFLLCAGLAPEAGGPARAVAAVAAAAAVALAPGNTPHGPFVLKCFVQYCNL